MLKWTRTAILLLMIAALLAACNLPRPNASETPAAGDPIGTAAAQTVAALSTQLAPQVTPSPQVVTPVVTAGPPTAAAPTATTAPSATSLPCDRGEFVDDVTVDDGTQFTPGENFTKTWRLKNTGSCTWTTGYKIVFDHGVALGAPASVNLTGSVAPGSTVDISVAMKAPDTPKEYESHWKMQNASGVTFGLGESGSKTFWVKIKVGTTAAPFAITRIDISADNANYSGSCPHTVTLSAAINATAGGRVTYLWERSDGFKTDLLSVDFDAAGSKTVTTTMSFNSSFDGWVKVYNDNPNHQYFPQFNFKVTCTP